MTQLVTRVDDAVAAAVDALVADGVVASRSDAVRRGLERLIDEERRRRVGESIVAGYQRCPQDEDEDETWADASTVAMIADEPW